MRHGRPWPQVIAHRGSSGDSAEHTLIAYQRAIREGADGLECDVRLTADGVPICVHDRRIDRTSDGRGVVSIKTYAELADRDFGSWKGVPGDSLTGTSASQLASSALLTLERLLELVTSESRPVDLVVETKHPVRFAGLVEERVVAILRKFGLTGPPKDDTTRVRVMSFSEIALRRMREFAPAVPTVYLMTRVPLRYRNGTLPSGAKIAGPGISILESHPEYVNRVHAAGGEVHVWVADSDYEIDLCLKLGVDALITNHPAKVMQRLGRKPPLAGPAERKLME